MPLEKYRPLPTIPVPKTSHEILCEIARKSRETPENYLLGSVALVALWGELITAGEGSKRFVHGIIDLLDKSCQEFDIREILRSRVGDEHREAEAATSPSEEVVQFAVPIEKKSAIDCAASYYDTSIPKLTRVAVNIRHEILNLQDLGHVYAIRYDDNKWQQKHIARVVCNPDHN